MYHFEKGCAKWQAIFVLACNMRVLTGGALLLCIIIITRVLVMMVVMVS